MPNCNLPRLLKVVALLLVVLVNAGFLSPLTNKKYAVLSAKLSSAEPTCKDNGDFVLEILV